MRKLTVAGWLLGLLCANCINSLSAVEDYTAPEIQATGWYNSDGVSLKSLRGKFVVLEFWATWCGPCARSIPHMIELNNKYKDKGLVIIGLTDEPKENIKTFVESHGMNYIIGAGSNTSNVYGIQGIPHVYVVNQEGELIWSGHPSELDPVIAYLMAASTPEGKKRMDDGATVAAAQTNMTALDYPAAIGKLRGIMAGPGDSQAKTDAAEKLKAIEALAAQKMKEAAGKTSVEACKIYLEVALVYADSATADLARTEASKLLANPEVAAVFHSSMKSK